MTRSASITAISACALLLTAGLASTKPRSSGAGAGNPKPTYASDVAPILNRSCVSCHHDGAVAPFSLVGYGNAKKWASNIASVTEGKAMPPWKAVEGYGEFLDDRQLSKADVEILQKWHEDGAPRGDKSKDPKPPVFTSEWPLGQPDLVLKPDKPFHLAAAGDDVYRNFVLKTAFDHPVWVKAMAVRPGNPKVVHHVIVFIDGFGAAEKLEQDNHDGQEGYTSSGGGVGFMPTGTLGGWAPGVTTRETPQGVAYLVKPGSTPVLQVHYHKSGKPEDDLTQVGLYFAKEPIQKQMRLDWIFKENIDIPAGDKEHHEVRERTVPADVTIYSAMPHMHLLGRSMKAEVDFPDGTVKPLIWVDDWDFRWQISYALKEPMHVPAGSKIKVEAVYDNSADNPVNPNRPPKEVTWGEQTTDEMFLLIVGYTLDHQTVADEVNGEAGQTRSQQSRPKQPASLKS